MVIVIPVTTPLEIVAVAVAVVDPIPTLTSGVVEYPTPPLLIVIEVIVPAEETTAVAAAPVTTTGFTNFIPFWMVFLNVGSMFSLLRSNNGLNLST